MYPTPPLSPAASDLSIQFVAERPIADQLSEHIKLSLQRLPLHNTIVSIPSFLQSHVFSDDDIAVVHAMQDIFQAGTVSLAKDPFAIHRPMRSVIITTSTRADAEQWLALLRQHTRLHAISDFELDPSQRQSALRSLLSQYDIVITHIDTLLHDAKSDAVSLRRLSLLVIDGAESVCTRAHPVAVLIRDHYRALPERHRPRLLALAHDVITASTARPLEYNLLSHFIASPSHTGAFWRSCLGKGERRELIDVEYRYYHPVSTDPHFVTQGLDKKRVPVESQRRDTRAFTELDHLVDQIGPLGVAAYCKKRKSIRQRRSTNGHHPARARQKPSVSDDIALLGLTNKAMCLLNEMHLAYAASTQRDQLMVIIYAGRPVVACALCEVLRSMPIFDKLCIRAALGTGSSASHHTYEKKDDFEERNWQGEETDDEEVIYFTALETNVLIVASPYLEQGHKNRPLPPTPLVIRFDGSLPDPTVDGGGGRCRVIVFQEHDKHRMSRCVDEDVTEKSADVARPDVPIPSNVQRSTTEEQPLLSLDDPPSVEDPPSAVKPVDLTDADAIPEQEVVIVKEQKGAALSLRPPIIAKPTANREKRVKPDRGTIYHCEAPKSLLGPDSDMPSVSYLYRLHFSEEKIDSKSTSPRNVRNTGVEDFIFVLSKELSEDDLEIRLADIVVGTGNGSNISGYATLEYQGSLTLTSEQVSLGRRYTTQLFSSILPGLHEDHFMWDRHIASGQKGGRLYRRLYLILPAKRKCEVVRPSTLFENNASKPSELPGANRVSDKKVSDHCKKAIVKYFQSAHTHTSEVSALGPCEVDWAKVHDVLTLCHSETHDKESKKLSQSKSLNYEGLEGRLLFSTFPNEPYVMSGKLVHDKSPLSTLRRSRKFPLNDDGTFAPSHDLPYLVKVMATPKTIAQQARTAEKKAEKDTGQDDDEVQFVSEKVSTPVVAPVSERTGDTAGLSPALWCEEVGKLVVSNGSTGDNRKRRTADNVGKLRFDCDRNVLKKRKTWAGWVSYSAEKYYTRFYDEPIQRLDQPLLPVAKPSVAGIEDLHEMIKGASVIDVYERLVSSGREKRMTVPELGRKYPISPGITFLPSSLFLLEQHLSTCQLRHLFDSSVGVRSSLGILLQAVTSSSVTSSQNYERLELLGDSVLKLSCTARLFTKRPHDSEGQMHYARKDIVSNATLHKLGREKGLQNYLRFRTETAADWRPPGTDMRGKVQSVTLKGLADVVEALCGAYFLTGCREENHVNDVVSMDDSADMQISLTGESSDESDDDVEIQNDCDTKLADRVNGSSGMDSARREKYRPFSPSSVDRGYIAGYKFLEACNVFQGSEPTHSQVLLSAAYAMHPKRSAPPTEMSADAFPYDKRISDPAVPWEEHYGILETAIGYKFKRRPLLVCALTHNSYVKENGFSSDYKETFQRLEFLGDAVADFCVVRYLYEKNPDLGPGELTTLKGNIVSNEAFARTTVTLGLHKFLEHKSPTLKTEIANYMATVSQDLTTEDELGGHNTLKKALGEIAAPKALGDVFESVLGAIFVDSGLQAAWKVCINLLHDSLRINGDPNRDNAHPCTELSSLVTREWKLGPSPPRYSIATTEDRKKVGSVFILGRKIATGSGTTLKRAKLRAAIAALKVLKDPSPGSRGYQLLRDLRQKAVQLKVKAQRYDG